jgi:hypothetical protein
MRGAPVCNGRRGAQVAIREQDDGHVAPGYDCVSVVGMAAGVTSAWRLFFSASLSSRACDMINGRAAVAHELNQSQYYRARQHACIVFINTTLSLNIPIPIPIPTRMALFGGSKHLNRETLHRVVGQLIYYGTTKSVYRTLTVSHLVSVCRGFAGAVETLPQTTRSILEGGDPLSQWIVEQEVWKTYNNRSVGLRWGRASVPYGAIYAWVHPRQGES